MTYSATAHGAATGREGGGDRERESERVSECEKEERERERERGEGGTLIHVYPVSHALAGNISSLLPIKQLPGSIWDREVSLAPSCLTTILCCLCPTTAMKPQWIETFVG